MKKMYLKLFEIKKVCFLIVPILFMSCSVSQKIAYKTDNIPVLSSTIPITSGLLQRWQ